MLVDDDPDPVRASAMQALRWQLDEAWAYLSAAIYLHQAANGEVPHD
jgi:hypothetical protein